MALSGALVEWLDLATLRLIAIKRRTGSDKQTGHQPTGTQPVIVGERVWEEDGLLFAELSPVGFSLWRSIELNLVRSIPDMFERPVLDLGCGDGVFCELAIGKAEYGVDLREDLAEIVRPGVYGTVQQGDAVRGLDLPDNSIGTVFANSVLEHITQLDTALSEFRRILRPGGRLIATVPAAAYYDGIALWMGEKASKRFHDSLDHVNLLTPAQWRERLDGLGYETELIREYFSPADGRFCRLISGSFVHNIESRTGRMVFRLLRRRIVKAVKRSLDVTGGYCELVVAKKR